MFAGRQSAHRKDRLSDMRMWCRGKWWLPRLAMLVWFAYLWARMMRDPNYYVVFDALNLGIQQGKIKNVGGMTLTRPLDGGLIREDNVVLYPVIDGIPALLNDEAIKLEEINA